ncbi:hypothetical protein BSKO_00616 [Bryopsis sp. KO-2023]|nr:hypothetical protein BSKO_00616 [Bryopsis sp. KO-2023]
MFRLFFLCAVLLVPRAIFCQKFDFKDDSFLFTVANAGDLLNGKILGQSLDEVLDDEVAGMLQDAGFTFGNDVVTFKVGVDDEVVDKRKCLYESELRDALVRGKIDVSEQLDFKANTSFIVHAEATLPLDMRLKGTLHTDLMAPLLFTCPHINDVEIPIASDILADVNLKVVVFLNPTVEKKNGKTLLMVMPEIKVFEEVTNIVASSDVEYKVFDKVRIKFLEGFLEDIVDEAIEKKGGRVLSRIVKRLKRKLQKYVDENLSGKEIDLGKQLDDADASGALEDIVALARIAFLAL